MSEVWGVLYWLLVIILMVVAWSGIIAVGYSLFRMHLDDKRHRNRKKPST